jgi:hypothetical protein
MQTFEASGVSIGNVSPASGSSLRRNGQTDGLGEAARGS